MLEMIELPDFYFKNKGQFLSAGYLYVEHPDSPGTWPLVAVCLKQWSDPCC